MEQASTHEITRLLQAWSGGDSAACDKLVPLLQSELHKLAHYYLRQERGGHVLQTTALVNEAYLRLVEWRGVTWKDRTNFYGVAAMLMRRVLVDYARQYPDLGGRIVKLGVEEATGLSYERSADLVALDDALTALAVLDTRKSQVVELRYFAGLSVEEIAQALDVSTRTVARDWDFAQAWLHRELTRDGNPDAASPDSFQP